MVELLAHCRLGGAAPSIDTAMHGLVDAPHVDHLHPDANAIQGIQPGLRRVRNHSPAQSSKRRPSGCPAEAEEKNAGQP